MGDSWNGDLLIYPRTRTCSKLSTYCTCSWLRCKWSHWRHINHTKVFLFKILVCLGKEVCDSTTLNISSNTMHIRVYEIHYNVKSQTKTKVVYSFSRKMLILIFIAKISCESYASIYHRLLVYFTSLAFRTFPV